MPPALAVCLGGFQRVSLPALGEGVEVDAGEVACSAFLLGEVVAVFGGVPPAAVAVGMNDQRAEVDQVVAAGAVAGEVGHVGGSAGRPGGQVVDLEAGAVAAGVETGALLLDEDGLALFQGGQSGGAADVEDMPGLLVDGEGG